ncbi:Spindle pole body protein ppc89 [Elsinoe australis]|uniref:Spindle pole body protein ppc89 n=1 Tax=Elsinoe australis TaxID=40998 RepID=A0A2P7YDT0_9PEZI|nr:Spindle pole body protein ppc89 [Elsinoe australis]
MAPGRESSGVIAQLARGQHRASRALDSSPALPGRFDGNNSTITSFQPDRESTQQFDTAADEQSWHGEGSEHSEEGDSMQSHSRSIELGRGVKRSARNTSGRYAFGQDMSEEQLLSIPDDSLYALTATPPNKNAARKSTDLRKQASVRRATIDRDADITKTSDIVPAKTRTGVGRRTLSDMHAKVHAVSDSSFVQPDPEARAAGTRNSRFSRARVSSAGQEVPTRFTSGAGLGRASEQTPRRSTSAADASLIGNQTAQSFALPDLPNIAELVSGIRKDGTPVFSRTIKPRSRFTSASFSRGGQESTEHRPVNSVALPEEEKAIFTSLQLLKEKVAQLEMEKSEAAKTAEQFENEIIALRSQVTMERRLRRPDSGFGSDEERPGDGDWRMERGRRYTNPVFGTRETYAIAEMQTSLKTVEQRLERAERKVSVSDIAVKRITQERDSLITQLGVAFYSNEELKEENLQLRSESEVLEDQKAALQEEITNLRDANSDLQRQLSASERSHDNDLRQWAVCEAELKARYKQRSSRDKERERPSQERASEDAGPRRAKASAGEDSQNKIMERVEAEVRKARAEAVRQSELAAKKPRELKSKSRSRSRPREEASKRFSAHAQNTSHLATTQASNNAAAAFRERWLDGLSDASSVSAPEKPSTNHKKARTQPATIPTSAGAEDSTKDITYLSFLDPSDLSALRRKLEAERLASKPQRATSLPTTPTDDKTRKSSMRDITAGLDLTGNDTRNVRVQSPATADHISYSTPEDGDVDASVVSSASRRPQHSRSFEEMTSAFILPDITLREAGKGKIVPAHDGENCTACPANEGRDVPVPTLVPVGEREDVDVTNMTVRPAEEPKVALTRVIKGLQDEVVHLKRELGERQREYALHDPSVGRRKRGEVKGRMDELVREVERRSEMVYRLYDVLEGQREGIEDTLRGLGIGVEVRRGGGSETESVDIVEGSLGY